MGEAANKMSRDRDHEVEDLRRRIEAKRQEIAGELAVLRQRRTQAVGTVKQSGKLVGMVAVGVLCVGSVANAFVDLFADESDEPGEDAHHLTLMLSEFALMALRICAAQFIRVQVGRLCDRFTDDYEAEAA